MEELSLFVVFMRLLLFAAGFAFLFWGLSFFKMYLKISFALIMIFLFAFIGFLIDQELDTGYLFNILLAGGAGFLGYKIAWPLHKLIIGIQSAIWGFIIFGIIGFFISSELAIILSIATFGAALMVGLFLTFHDYFIIGLMIAAGLLFIIPASLTELWTASFHENSGGLETLIDLFGRQVLKIITLIVYSSVFSVWFQKWNVSSGRSDSKIIVKSASKKISYIFCLLALVNLLLINIFQVSFAESDINTLYFIGGINYVNFAALSILATILLSKLTKYKKIVSFINKSRVSNYIFIIIIVLIIIPIMSAIVELPFHIQSAITYFKTTDPSQIYRNGVAEPISRYVFIAWSGFVRTLLGGIYGIFQIDFSSLGKLSYIIYKISQITIVFLIIPRVFKGIIEQLATRN